MAAATWMILGSHLRRKLTTTHVQVTLICYKVRDIFIKMNTDDNKCSIPSKRKKGNRHSSYCICFLEHAPWMTALTTELPRWSPEKWMARIFAINRKLCCAIHPKRAQVTISGYKIIIWERYKWKWIYYTHPDDYLSPRLILLRWRNVTDVRIVHAHTHDKIKRKRTPTPRRFPNSAIKTQLSILVGSTYSI